MEINSKRLNNIELKIYSTKILTEILIGIIRSLRESSREEKMSELKLAYEVKRLLPQIEELSHLIDLNLNDLDKNIICNQNRN